ncbi:hypothetical protein Syn7803US13_77 [Synechococcus phage ACG-2014f]|uniref:Uncharacterized protein n=3 Tax=Atlauavirus TaxID=2733092 RepID=A0A0E3HKZ6_9CAUD|nr:hypothetical protein HOQ62_gp079 [Synechococcus phage ACG-2014f_Syn7803C8]YP_009778804.1 hypothetical protein HOQ63_gp077 [Synechococcus phage ACG-2014f_Syn7803US26]AIX23272.1 hypothetical protein Syn7803C9_82 [Synechococcus phage ACG-2014f]AIX21403.1 hypothetical protein Syn7803C8_79 [Synechococcus phage ACG-2014f_Syn7803C8]AIX27437.1 hypothetical protein Syn7803US13_77 [Synechococcus phage ACG-2014f]AIX28930.1 hypothetical protein Syn7803US26_77 [Synechococcus phage ACG-2014f_Syn7803US26]
MNHNKVAEALHEEVTDYIFKNHYRHIKSVYTDVVEEYIEREVGPLTEKNHKQLVKQLVKFYIS